MTEDLQSDSHLTISERLDEMIRIAKEMNARAEEMNIEATEIQSKAARTLKAAKYIHRVDW